MSVTFAKLKSGEWGLRSTSEIVSGQTVSVSVKAGGTKQATVGKVLWSGNGVWLATQVGGGSNGSGRSRGSHVCAECGRGGELVSDLEDGLMKHRRCCDIEP